MCFIIRFLTSYDEVNLCVFLNYVKQFDAKLFKFTFVKTTKNHPPEKQIRKKLEYKIAGLLKYL